MESITAAASVRRPRRAAGALVACALLTAGCGSMSDYKNQPRLPSPIVLGTSIDASRVSVSPTRIGAGPILLVITNQSPAAHSLTLQSDATPQSDTPRGRACHLDQSSPFFCQSTSPISPQGTAQLAGVLREGRYRVQVDDAGVQSAELVVGPPRPSAQNQVLQP